MKTGSGRSDMITEQCPCWPEQHRGLRPTSHSVVVSNSQVVRPSMPRIIHSNGFRIISRFGRTKLRPVWCRFEARREVFHSVDCSLVLCTWKCIIIGFHTVPRGEGQNSCGVNSQIQCVRDRRSSYACYGLFKWMRIWTIWVFRWLSFGLRKLDVCEPEWLRRWASVHACTCPVQDSINNMYATSRRTALYWRGEQRQEALFGDNINHWCRGGWLFLP